jgi:hypothetical protein
MIFRECRNDPFRRSPTAMLRTAIVHEASSGKGFFLENIGMILLGV